MSEVNELEWKVWWLEFKELAVERNWPVNCEDPGTYKELYDNDYTPLEAILEESGYGD